jgi:hypothetical protein
MPSELVCNSDAALRRFLSIQAAEFKNNSALQPEQVAQACFSRSAILLTGRTQGPRTYKAGQRHSFCLFWRTRGNQNQA